MRTVLALLALFALPALAGDIFRHRTADGRTIFTNSPTRPEGAVESRKYSDVASRLVALVPGTPSNPIERERAQSEVRLAETDLMRAYNRLTAEVLPRQDEIMEIPAIDPAPPIRGRPVKLPKTPEYYARIGELTADINRAQKRLDAARERFYALN